MLAAKLNKFVNINNGGGRNYFEKRSKRSFLSVGGGLRLLRKNRLMGVRILEAATVRID